MMTKKAEKPEELTVETPSIEKQPEPPRAASMTYDQRISRLEDEVAQLQRLVAQLMAPKGR